VTAVFSLGHHDRFSACYSSTHCLTVAFSLSPVLRKVISLRFKAKIDSGAVGCLPKIFNFDQGKMISSFFLYEIATAVFK